MTKSGANGPKSRARSRAERSGTKYIQARRGGAAEPGAWADPGAWGEMMLTSFHKGEPLPWGETVSSWQCHRCGASTDTCALVLGTGTVGVRAYCPGPSCLPPLADYPALRAFAHSIQVFYLRAGSPSTEALGRYVEAVTGGPAAAAVRNVLSGTVLARWDTVRALVHALGGDEVEVQDVLPLWQAAEREQTEGTDGLLTSLARQERFTGLPRR
ncbi:hypothetical protein ADK54_17890 [Streptomyces sp. WM6378]|nr:hypothetical protein ADK54_17890 [Streptomyces sp. WM6378]